MRTYSQSLTAGPPIRTPIPALAGLRMLAAAARCAVSFGIEGFIGYQPKYQDNSDGVIGTLSFTDGEVVINTINFVTKDTQKSILRYVPDMEFIPINSKDKVLDDKKSIDLWSKNFSKSNKDLSDFRFLVHLVDDSTGKTYTQELTFSNGRVNENQKREFDISID